MTSVPTGELSAQLALLKDQNSKAFDAVIAIEAAGGARIDTEAAMGPDSPSIAETHAKIYALIGMVDSILEATGRRLLLVPATHLSGLPKEIQRIADTFTNLLSQLDGVVKSHGGFGAIDTTGFTIQSQDAQAATNLTDVYQNVRSHTDAALDRAHRILSIISPENYDAFAGAVGGIEEALGALAKARQEAAEHLKYAKAAAAAATEEARRALQNADLAHGSRQSAEDSLGKINTSLEQAAKLQKDIEAVASQALVLKSQIDNYQKIFADFEAKLAERNKLFEEGKLALDNLLVTRTAALDALVTSLQGHNDTATTIIANAKTALGWGTAEGLSSSFATSAAELDDPLSSTMFWFVVSLLVLAGWVFSVFILAPQLDPALSMLHVPAGLDGLSAGAYMLGAVAVRLAAIAPAFILVLFFGRRYRILYAARELYIFKKTVAASLPGFAETAAPKDADPHVKAMTAAAYERLLFNPREQATNDLGDAPRGGILSRWLTRLIKEALDDSKKGAGN